MCFQKSSQPKQTKLKRLTDKQRACLFKIKEKGGGVIYRLGGVIRRVGTGEEFATGGRDWII